MGEPHSRAWTVVSGTFLVSLASTCITGLYATFSSKTRPYASLATAAAFNSAVTAATFFTIREYLVSPARAQIEGPPLQNAQLSWSSLRRQNLLDSGISGLATGGLIRGLTAGRRVILPAALTVGAASVVLQAAYNELHVQRIKYIGQLSRPPPPEPESVIEAHKPPLRERILGALGVRTLSNEELLVKLTHERERHLKRIAELEVEKEAQEK
ncbi:hypothetical protein C8F01DRAFT_1133239 [Mycena amicta]|nr:hypothetical protein C8F01DRAFT_1133239 [Mycena amicta]